MNPKASEANLPPNGVLSAVQSQRLLNFIRRRMSPQLRALFEPEDLLQDVWLAAEQDRRTRKRARPAKEWIPWLYGVAQNRILRLSRDLQPRLRPRKSTALPASMWQGDAQVLGGLDALPSEAAVRGRGAPTQRTSVTRLPGAAAPKAHQPGPEGAGPSPSQADSPLPSPSAAERTRPNEALSGPVESSGAAPAQAGHSTSPESGVVESGVVESAVVESAVVESAVVEPAPTKPSRPRTRDLPGCGPRLAGGLQEASYHDLQDRAWNALAGLEDCQRLSIVLRGLLQVNWPTIAKVSGRGQEALRKRHARGLQELKRRLDLP